MNMNAQNNHKKGAQSWVSRYWLDVLEEHNVSYMALDPVHDQKLIEQLQTRPDWIVEYTTEDAIFFVREAQPLGS
jgi:hypothetical protein